MSHLVVTLLREIHVFLGEIQMKFYQAEDCCFPEKSQPWAIIFMPIFIYDIPLLCNGLLSGGTKPLSEPKLTYQQSSHVTFTSRQSRFQIF